MPDFMPFLTPTWWFWLWISFQVAVRTLPGVGHATSPIYVAMGGLPPVGVAGILADHLGRRAGHIKA